MSATVGDLDAKIRQLIAQAQEGRKPVEGFVTNWDPNLKTIHATVGHTATLPPSDEFDNLINHQPVPLLTPFVGFHGGPVGNERVILFPYEGGMVAMLFAGTENAPEPPVPAGELHGYFRNSDGTVNSVRFIKLQPDAVRLGHDQSVIVEAPQFLVGMEQASSSNAVPRQMDTQQLANDIINAVQQAFNQFAQTVQPGSGAPPPTVAQVTANASQSSYTK